MKSYQNIYRAARMQAAQSEPMFSSRERTAAELFVSTVALQDYETGKSLPPCDVVQRMVEVYGDAVLKRSHIRHCCPLLPDYGGDSDGELTRAALRWAVELGSMKETAFRFAALAVDGKITPEELVAAEQIRSKAVDIRRMMEDTILAIDIALKGVEK